MTDGIAGWPYLFGQNATLPFHAKTGRKHCSPAEVKWMNTRAFFSEPRTPVENIAISLYAPIDCHLVLGRANLQRDVLQLFPVVPVS